MTGILNILDYKEASAGGTDWTEAFRLAVEDIKKNQGGMLFVPAGEYRTRSIELTSNMTLYLCAGSELSFSDEIEKYEILDGEFEGISGPMYKPLIYMSHLKNVSIKGEGKINGNGRRWWEKIWDKSLVEARPCLIYFEYCENVKIENVYLTMSPVWTVHPLYSKNVVIHGVTIVNPADSPNTDGINPDSCQNVRISDCYIDVGDDCIAIKAGVEETPVKRVCENITITNCNMIHGHGGVVIGSEMSGGVRNVVVSNCLFQDTDRGIRLKTRRRRGGFMEQLSFNNIIMDRVMCPFVFNMYYFCGKLGKEPWVSDRSPAPVDEGTPAIRDINISNMTVMNATSCAGVISGLPEQYVENIRFSNCQITMSQDGEAEVPAMMSGIGPMKGAGFYMRNARGIRFDEVTIKNVLEPEVDMDESVELIRK